MALTAFMLSEAVTSAKRGGYAGKVAPYEFATDNINECMSEMGYMLMMESNEMAEAFMITDEIMAEAAISNPDVVDSLTESVFSKIKDGVKKFFDKIISMVKGIIDKLKAYFYKMTNKTQKWLTVMKPKIEAVKSNQTGYEKVTAETYAYDKNYINDGMNAGVKALADEWAKTVIPMNKATGGAATSLKDQVANLKSTRQDMATSRQVAGASDDKPASAVDAKNADLVSLEKQAKDAATALEDYKKKFPKLVASKMGASNATTLDAVWTDCAKKARGGKSEKTTITVGNQVDAMISALEGMDDAVTKMKDTYESHLKDLTDFKSDLDADDFKIEDDAKVPGNLMTAVRNVVSAQYKYITEVTSMVEQAMNSAKSHNLAYLQEMSQAYMSSLTTFAAYKASKKS